VDTGGRSSALNMGQLVLVKLEEPEGFRRRRQPSCDDTSRMMRREYPRPDL